MAKMGPAAHSAATAKRSAAIKKGRAKMGPDRRSAAIAKGNIAAAATKASLDSNAESLFAWPTRTGTQGRQARKACTADRATHVKLAEGGMLTL